MRAAATLKRIWVMSWAFWDMQKIYGLMSTNPAFKDSSDTGPSLLGLQTGLMPDVELSELAVLAATLEHLVHEEALLIGLGALLVLGLGHGG